MENSRYTISFGLSLAVASVFNAVLVVVKEKIPAAQVSMQRITGHHWITHSLAVVLVFAILGGALAQSNKGQGPSLSLDQVLKIVLAGAILSVGIIVGFYALGG